MIDDRQQKLLDFVKEAHGDQVRKYTGEPYWHHCRDVGLMFPIKRYKGTPGLYGREIGFCHDLFEDTDVTPVDLTKELLGMDYTPYEVIYIIDGTTALTDVYTSETHPFTNRTKRKELEAIRLGRIDPDFQTVKLCDLIHNSESIITHDPRFSQVYIPEKITLLEKMREGDIYLYIKACSIIQKYIESQPESHGKQISLGDTGSHTEK